MLPAITALLVLQNRDQSLRELQRDLERIPAEEGRAKERMHAVERAVEVAHKALQENELAIRKLEMDVKTRRDSITRMQIQRFETRKNEEYTAIGHEIDTYEAQVRGLEDRELELMETAEKLKAAHDAAQHAHAEVKRVMEDELAAYRQRRQQEEQRIAELRELRAAAHAAVTDDAALALYDRLAARKFPPVVAMEAGDTCGGCHMKLTGSTASDVRAHKRIVCCDHCGRIVHPQ